MVQKYPYDRSPYRHPDFKQREGESVGEWRNRARYIWDQWNRNRFTYAQRHNVDLPRVDPPASLRIGVTPKPPHGRPNDSIPYNEWQRRERGEAGPLIDAFNNQRPFQIDNPVAGPSGISDAGGSISTGRQNTPEDIERLLAESDNQSNKRKNVEDHSPNPPPSQDPEMTRTRSGAGSDSNGAEVMDVEQPRGVNSSKSDGGFDSAQGPATFIESGGYDSSGGHMYFKKIHHMSSYALPFEILVSGTNKYTTTPLSEIPWNKMFFYMSLAEFDLIPPGSHVESCKISIMNIISSTQHLTNSTNTEIATFNHPKIGILGYDLANRSRGGLSRRYTMSATEDMTVSALAADQTYADFIKKQYGTDQMSATWDSDELPGVCFPIVYKNYHYFTVYQPTRAAAVTAGFTAANAPGYENFSSCITQFNLNDRTWDTVFQKEYRFTNAPVKSAFRSLEINTGNFNQSVGNHMHANIRRTVTNVGPAGDLTITETFNPSIQSKVNFVTYLGDTIEQGSNVTRGDGTGKPSRQPTVHFGMKAIPKISSLTNNTRADAFVHAEVYYVVTAEMTVKTNGYPNRFILPKVHNVSLENFLGGTGYKNTTDATNVVSFGLNADVAM